ncbi:MAG: bifunctional hydroxymethylpyrimidine kinase/phosphomethylpyrimidine kinase [Terriglobales bacterium]
MGKTPPVVLTIAGFDPSCGAGITADVKTIAANGCYAIACITGMTVQSTKGVRRVQPVPPEFLAESLEELALDMKISAIHIGMLGSAEVAEVVADFLSAHAATNVVLDPVLKATSGLELLDKGGLAILVEKIMPVATVITPNLQEASVISGLPVNDQAEMKTAARKLHGMGSRTVVITGGHLERPVDLLSQPGKSGVEQQFFEAEPVHSSSTHGTGCALSAALACHLARGRSLAEGVPRAQAYVRAAIAEAYPIGRGIGPINHLYRMPKEE